MTHPTRENQHTGMADFGSVSCNRDMKETASLAALGWNERFEREFSAISAEGMVPARIARQDRGRYMVLCAQGEWSAELTGRFSRDAGMSGDYPVTGDWVAARRRHGEDKADIHALVPRMNALLRARPSGDSRPQALAANIDAAFMVCALDEGRGFNLRRIERMLLLARSGGVEPVVILNKCDLCEDPDSYVARAEMAAPGERVIAVSGATGAGLDPLRRILGPGKTAAFIGPSGVGKSTLINALAGGGVMEVGPVRDDDMRGRHTTTARELVFVPGFGMLIDTPGIREIGSYADSGEVGSGFAEIEEIAQSCRYRDCRHEGEPGCAVQAAVAGGSLDSGRFENFIELRREAEFLEDRKGYVEKKEEKFKKIGKWCKELQKKRKDR